MAISVVQTVSHGAAFDAAATSYTLTVSATSTSNLLAIAAGAAADGTGTVAMSVTDNGAGGSNTWSAAVSDTPTLGSQCIYIFTTTATNPKSITSVTVTNTVSSNMPFWFYEIAGANNSSPVDKTAHAGNVGSTSPNSGTTATPTGSTDLALGAFFYGTSSNPSSSPTFTSGSGTNQGEVLDFPSFVTPGYGLNASYLVLSSATGQAFSGTLASSGAWRAAIVLIAASAPTISTGGTLGLMGVG